MSRSFGFRLIVVFALVLAVPVVARAETTAQDVGYGTGSVFSTLGYAPLKGTFCILGGITSVFTLPFGGTRTAGNVASAACGGTWAITPSVLKGQERVRFIGTSASTQSSENRPTASK